MGKRGVRPGENFIELDYAWQGQRRRERLPWRPTSRNVSKAELFKAELDESVTELDLFRVYERYYPTSRYYLGNRIDALLTDWIERKVKDISPSTAQDYLNSIDNYLVPFFGSLHVQQLRWRHVLEFLEELGDVTVKRKHNVLIPLKRVCQEAVNSEQVQVSPFQGKTIEGRRNRHEPDPLTVKEISALLKKADSQFANFIEFNCYTGLRTGEMLGLTWDCIDWVNGVVRVRENVVVKVRKGPKTAAGRRDVTLLQPALDALQRQKSHSFMAGDAVFLNPVTGRPWDTSYQVRERWVPLLKRAGVRYRRPYSMRDTYASLMLTSGLDPVWLANQMGHEDWATIRRTYAKWMPEESREDDRARALFGTKRQRNAEEK